ncbi:MAG: GGDEF domain-containing protein [Firmicutes bacterium]|jgi:diguanylate cyclase (GGDEF)-like protein|uniref:GGDEF domain-containing protein n=1 Tax=Sulfobacillus benefaciens TaxID=453960 RepID=A0A2T2X4C7_9FIRM|nr:GGDEF domain-containing protein [Bacillota bacterium]MCL5013992.1 GGDEF domain-containing protein [Bacillota bacterium]PSR29350.1 MAG: hypothetical protein C7B43_08380 [Sulfobacillus benefaciens]
MTSRFRWFHGQSRPLWWKLSGVTIAGSIVTGAIAIHAIENVPLHCRHSLWIALIAEAFVWILLWIIWNHVVATWQKRALRDSLTGLARPTAFWEFTEYAALQQGASPWVIAYLDLDNFKQVNDRWGHGTGDAVLKMWGRLLLSQSRNCDIIGRLGGEEIGWWFPHTTAEEAQTALERVLHLCCSTSVDGLAGFSFSAGIASGQAQESVWDAARRADRALYEAKRAGKGRVSEASL